MVMIRGSYLLVMAACLGTLFGPVARAAEPADQAQQDFFERKVRPVLANRCFKCHGPESEAEGGLRVDSLAALLAGGDSGPAIKPGQPQASLLIDAVNHGSIVQMPPKSKLPAAEIADLTAWVKAGALWPNAALPVPAAAVIAAEPPLTDKDRAFWAFVPPQDPAPPAVNNAGWCRSPLDRFVLAALEAKGLAPAPAADKRTLIRRVTLDLIGLPPTAEEVNAFLADSSDQALSTVVDRLLASPRYGERWGRQWLDLARYADSNGMDENMCFANAWRYRDYVIGAFNKDKPFDRFVHEQLAGDLLPTASADEAQEALIGTGFLVLGPKMLAEDDPVKMEMDIIDEQVDTVGKAFLGLTLGCARCHDHKFDPVSAADYYGLAGIFKSTKSMENFTVVAMWAERPLATPALLAKAAEHDKQLAETKAALDARAKLAADEFLAAERSKLAKYLLAATSLERGQTAIASLISTSAGTNLPAGSIVVEAEKFARGNPKIDFETYGKEIGVIYNAGPLPNFAEYDIEVPAAGTYQLELRYAAAESRPVALSVNGRVIKKDVAAATTGSWGPETQRWSVAGIVVLSAGKNVVRLERELPFPHFDKLALVPRELPTGGQIEQPLSIDEVVQQQGLNRTILDQWIKQLAAARKNPKSVFAPWFAFGEAIARGERPLLKPADDPLIAALVKEPHPASVAELAARYQQLCLEAQQAFIALQQTPAGAVEKQLPDATAEMLRQVVVDPAGAFALSADAEKSYPAAAVADLAAMRQSLTALEKARPTIPQAMAVSDQKSQNLRVHLRGSHLTLGAEVERRLPRVLASENRLSIEGNHSGRLELARWLTRPDHPLTSRVIVNRLWQGHFGQGLVRSVDNFGRLGELPDNQPLLDWLSRRMIENRWSIKAMHRLIMLSSAYQMSTAYSEQAAAVDPENRLLWRMHRRRMDVEQMRDTLLSVSGSLDLAMGGTLLTNKNHEYVTSTASHNGVQYDLNRRSIYLPVVRSALYDLWQAFDFADPSTMSGQRSNTTVAPQALFMMNSKLMTDASGRLADNLLARADLTDAGRVAAVYERAYSRQASEQETARALVFVKAYDEKLMHETPAPADHQRRAWQGLCRVILSANELIYVE